MPTRFPKSSLAGVALLLAWAAAVARPDPPPADPANDPLPDGAKVRYGVTRPILRTNPAVGLVPPGYTNFLAPTMAGGVRRYDLGTGKPLEKALDAGGLVGPGQVFVSADGKRAAVCRPGTVGVVDAATGRLLMTVQPPEGVVLAGTPAAALSADGSVLAYGGRAVNGKGEVVVWDVPRNELLARFETVQAPPVFPTLSADGRTLVTYGPPLRAPTLAPAAPAALPPAPDPDAARTAQVWDVPNIKEMFRARVPGMGGLVVAAAFSPDAGRVALSAGDGPVDVWDVKTGKRVHTLLGRKAQGVRVAYSPDGKTIASVGPDYRIQRWAADGTPVGVTDPPPGMLVAQVTGLAFADNERAVAWMTAAQFCVAWEAPTGRLLSPLTEHIAPIWSIAIPDVGKEPGGPKDLFTSGVDGFVFRWNYPTGAVNEGITLHPARIPGQPLIRPVVKLSADATLATWARTPAEVFTMDTGADVFCIPPPSTPPAQSAVMPSDDGTKVVTVSRQPERGRAGACDVWDLRTQRRMTELEIPSSTTVPIPSVSPSGTRMVVATSTWRPEAEAAVLLVTGWDLKGGRQLAEVVDATASGQLFVTAVDDTTAVLSTGGGRLWAVDYAAGRVGLEIDKLPTRGEAAVYSPAVVSPDGKRIATGVVGDQIEDYGVRVYDWPAGKLTHTFTGHLGPVTALRFSPDGQSLASGAQDASVILWDLTKPRKK